MNPILTIAKNTFRQTIRDKILYGILIFALIFICSTIVIGSLALEENIFIIRSLGLAGIYIFGLIITVFLGASIVYDEVERRTTYFLLAKPVTRGHIILGKFLGLLAGIGFTTLLMTAAYLAIVSLNGGGLDGAALITVGLQLFEMGILISALILFSIFTTPLAATIYTILILYIGHLLSFFLDYAARSTGASKIIMTGLYYALPNLEKFNMRNLAAHNITPPVTEIVLAVAYSVLYVALFIYLAILIFNKKDL